MINKNDPDDSTKKEKIEWFTSKDFRRLLKEHELNCISIFPPRNSFGSLNECLNVSPLQERRAAYYNNHSDEVLKIAKTCREMFLFAIYYPNQIDSLPLYECHRATIELCDWFKVDSSFIELLATDQSEYRRVYERDAKETYDELLKEIEKVKGIGQKTDTPKPNTEATHDKEPPKIPEPDNSLKGAKQLADKYGVPLAALRKRLERWRNKSENISYFRYDNDHMKNESNYKYKDCKKLYDEVIARSRTQSP